MENQRALKQVYEAYERDGVFVIEHSASGSVICFTPDRDNAKLVIRCLNEDIARIESINAARRGKQ